ncbi:B-box zinc finger protein 20-like [Cornus florida]|uniref:B-box zinc finger protein 20-like n=1 Tax=Cornus florida TaxID=4283 RepID=UPI00289C539E|nr:B-box zinc finger protein 20-like [Cornus florida]
MKIQCDVCDKEEASVFCSADEAALCDGCDHRVHHANKLAGRHLRFSLLHPPFKDSPSCDICQERRALLFCQEDRAILCKECDIPIHKANEHTQKHNRFLLTGVKLSPFFSSYPASSSSNYACEVATDSEVKSSVSNQFYNDPSDPSDYEQNPLPSTSTSTVVPSKVDHEQEGSISTSSISEYLMETLPGWQVEDFLDPACSSHGFCKVCNTPESPD